MSHKTTWTNVDVCQLCDALFNISFVFGMTKIQTCSFRNVRKTRHLTSVSAFLHHSWLIHRAWMAKNIFMTMPEKYLLRKDHSWIAINLSTIPAITLHRTAVLKYELKTYSSWTGSYPDDWNEDYILSLRPKNHLYIWKFFVIIVICLNFRGQIKIIIYDKMCGQSEFPHEIWWISTGLSLTWRTTAMYRFNNISCSELRFATFYVRQNLCCVSDIFLTNAQTITVIWPVIKQWPPLCKWTFQMPFIVR